MRRGSTSSSNSSAADQQRYDELGLADALRRPYDYPAACRELALILRLAYSDLSKQLQSALFRDTLSAFQSLPLVQTGYCVASANALLQAAEASLPKQKRVLAVTEFKRAVVAHKRRNKACLDRGFLHVPQDVLIQIFKFLDLRSLIAVSFVCWTWHQAASEETLWKMLFSNFFGTCNIRSDMLSLGTATLSSKIKGCDAIPSINWKEEFKSRYRGEKYWKTAFNRAICSECITLIWMTSISSVSSHKCENLECSNGKLRPISPNKVVDYLLGEAELMETSSDSDDSDDSVHKLWAYPKLISK